MAAISDLLRQIPDKALRERLEQEFERLSKNKKFGIVFEEHIPECTPLYDISIRPGITAAKRAGKISDLYAVSKIEGCTALCLCRSTSRIEEIPVQELVAVAQFGDPIFPSLIPMGKVENAPDSKLWHTLIEADNYHALQLLEYLYPKQVDCIYIDPPYNTGARDWKYNNDYVDASDSWRHSKWLSMMQKRLRIAKRILNPKTGVLICAIDDYEISHLLPLMEDIFPDYNINTVIVNHHPQGGGGDNISRTHEYALFLTPIGRNILRGNKREGFVEQWALSRSGKDARNFRYGRPNQFYALYIDPITLEVKGVGERLSREDSYSTEDTAEGYKAIYPISKKDGSERVWRYERATMLNLIEEGNIFCTPNFSLKVVKRRDVKYDAIFSLWSDPKYNAGTNGTDLLTNTLGINGFAYPKSLYTVVDAVKFSVQDNPNALIVDFFAGSGTTLHAVNLLNAEDGGKRRCILVTNNEVSDADQKELTAAGFQPGDLDWESHGICRSVTWPRTEYSILGKRADGTVLTGEYYTSITAIREVDRSFVQLGFIDNPSALATNAKKQIVALLGKDKLPQSLVKSDSKFIVSDKHTTSILFDSEAAEDWLTALEEQEHITDFYIVAKESRTFSGIKERVVDLLGKVRISEPVKRPMSEGFPANVEYYKLGFLDRQSVTLGRQFREILPLLWMKTGSVGKRPLLDEGAIPPMMILQENGFAVLTDETKFATFAHLLTKVESVHTIFFVTNSEEAFREMSEGVKVQHTYQLYRDYIDNFVLGSRREML